MIGPILCHPPFAWQNLWRVVRDLEVRLAAREETLARAESRVRQEALAAREEERQEAQRLIAAKDAKLAELRQRLAKWISLVRNAAGEQRAPTRHTETK